MDAITEKSIGLDGQVFAERRVAARRRVLKGAKLTFNKGYGALLAFGETAAVPPSFALAINGEEAGRQARVRWRSPTLVGVAFEQA